jgi:DNA-binding IclR family transcriptional regulator
MPEDEGRARAGVKSADRALAILELLIHADRPLGFGEILTTLGYPRSSLFSLLNTLHDRGWIAFDEPSRTYRLGIRTFEAGSAWERSIDLLPLALPHMERIRDALDETVQISVLEGRYNVYLGKVEGGQRLGLASEVGRRLEAHATALGKMLLADVPTNDLDDLFAGKQMETFTPNTLASMRKLHEELETIRARGHATDNEEYTLGVRCVATPIRNHLGGTIAALSVSFPTFRYSDDRSEQALALLYEAVDHISSVLGYRASMNQDADAHQSPHLAAG